MFFPENAMMIIVSEACNGPVVHFTKHHRTKHMPYRRKLKTNIINLFPYSAIHEYIVNIQICATCVYSQADHLSGIRKRTIQYSILKYF